MRQIKPNIIPFFAVILLLFIRPPEINGQFAYPEPGHVYTDTIVPRIYIIMNPSDLAALYANPLLNDEYPCTFVFNNTFSSDTLVNTGIRIRGNTSRMSAKKSFKLSFNTFVKGRKYNHLEKLNLNGEHNDPSIIRSKICWDLLRKMGVPAPRANHVELYINGNYYGLYINVEDIDENFVNSRFGNKDGNLYKCLYPADLIYLSPDPNAYKEPKNGNSRAYELQSNEIADDYSDLSHFISVLNNTPSDDLPEELEKVFDVNNFLKIAAIDILTGNWDDYLFNKNNLFLYHNTETGQFEYIPYDLDNTFGIDWFGIDWATRSIYSWGASESRPLFDRIMLYPAYKERFSYYMKLAVTNYFNPTVLNPLIGAKKNLIAASAQTDLFRTYDYGWSYSDFLNSYDKALTAHVKYGLIPYIESRYNSASSQVSQTSIAPVITWVHTNNPMPDVPLVINAIIEDDDSIQEAAIHYSINDGPEQMTNMFDDGLHQDLAAGDHYFGSELSSFPDATRITYYIEAADKDSKLSRAPVKGWYQYNVANIFDGIVINETIHDELNAYPNPFSYTLSIEIPSGMKAPMTMRIYDYTARLVFSKNIQDGNPGILQWDGHDNNNNSLPDGLYFIKLEPNSTAVHRLPAVKKIMLLR